MAGACGERNGWLSGERRTEGHQLVCDEEGVQEQAEAVGVKGPGDSPAGQREERCRHAAEGAGPVVREAEPGGKGAYGVGGQQRGYEERGQNDGADDEPGDEECAPELSRFYVVSSARYALGAPRACPPRL